MLYEIETRAYFNSQEEAFNTLPFLYDCLNKKVEFETRMYGVELFNSGNSGVDAEVYNEEYKSISGEPEEVRKKERKKERKGWSMII